MKSAFIQRLLFNVSHVSNFTKSMSFILSKLYIQFQNKESNVQISYRNVTYTMHFNVHGSVHRKNILIYIQQDAMLHSLFYLKTALYVLGGTSTRNM
jgi:hypothetical protein